jgi:tetratricopeptide (TPR) repeat protein
LAGIADCLEKLFFFYFDEKKYERVIDRVREVMEVDRRPSDVALYAMAISADWLGVLDRAEKYYREAMVVNPRIHNPFNPAAPGAADRGLDICGSPRAVRLRPSEVYRGWRAILWRRAATGTLGARSGGGGSDALRPGQMA